MCCVRSSFVFIRILISFVIRWCLFFKCFMVQMSLWHISSVSCRSCKNINFYFFGIFCMNRRRSMYCIKPWHVLMAVSSCFNASSSCSLQSATAASWDPSVFLIFLKANCWKMWKRCVIVFSEIIFPIILNLKMIIVIWNCIRKDYLDR